MLNTTVGKRRSRFSATEQGLLPGVSRDEYEVQREVLRGGLQPEGASEQELWAQKLKIIFGRKRLLVGGTGSWAEFAKLADDYSVEFGEVRGPIFAVKTR